MPVNRQQSRATTISNSNAFTIIIIIISITIVIIATMTLTTSSTSPKTVTAGTLNLKHLKNRNSFVKKQALVREIQSPTFLDPSIAEPGT